MHFVEAKSLLTRWNAMNVYRGCAHGCVYCDSRSACYRFTHAFEDIEVKQNAPELLEGILQRKRKKTMISTGSMSDPYQPCEEDLGLTRRCLELLDQHGFGATVITKSDMVLRDIDILSSINEKAKAVVQISLTVADEQLGRKLEPNVCGARRRYEALKEFQSRGIPTVVWMTPLLPFITDTRENFETLLKYCFDAGVKGIVCFNVGMTLRDGNREHYYQALDRLFPGMAKQYREKYGDAYKVISDNNEALMTMFHDECEKRGILHTPDECFRFTSELPEKHEQLTIFDSCSFKE